jgi:hypothetical protein
MCSDEVFALSCFTLRLRSEVLTVLISGAVRASAPWLMAAASGRAHFARQTFAADRILKKLLPRNAELCLRGYCSRTPQNRPCVAVRLWQWSWRPQYLSLQLQTALTGHVIVGGRGQW